jgi:hypothetical protein
MRGPITPLHLISDSKDVEKKGEAVYVCFSNVTKTQISMQPPAIDTSVFSVIPGAIRTIWTSSQRANALSMPCAITKTKYTDVCPASHDVLPDESHKHHIQQEYDEQMLEETHDIERKEDKENVVNEEDQTIPDLKAEYASVSQVSKYWS